jgi:thioredoxin-related protein
MRIYLYILLFVSSLFAGTIPFETNYEHAMKRAVAENKPVMAVITQTYCPWCTKFKERTLTDPDVAKMVNEHFVPLLLNKDTDAMPEDIRARMVPTTFFLDHEGEEIFSSIGYKHPRKFLLDIHDAIELGVEEK